MRQALELALEGLREEVRMADGWQSPAEAKAITAIKEALAQPEQEPVAVKHMMEWVDYLKRKSDYGQHLQISSEMSAGACWDLARELEQFINTTPPQPEKLDQDEVDIRSRLYQRIHELECVLKDIAEYTGEGPPTTDWQGIVKLISDSARNALEDKEMIKE